MSAGFFVGRKNNEVLRVDFADGRTATGRCMIIAERHYIVCHGPGLPLIGKTEGPLEAMDVIALEVVQTYAEVRAKARQLMMGVRIPGREPQTRDDFEHRLRTLAQAKAALPKEEWQREMQILRQFNEVADRIRLAAPKRQWMLNEARWRLRSNAEPTMADLWIAPTASPSCLARPRPQDFDPDPAIRRKRVPVSPAARADPRGISNMLAAMKARGLQARIARLGDPPHSRGEILIKMPIKGRAQFAAIAERDSEGDPLGWRLVWDGNESQAGLRRHRAAQRTPEYGVLVEVLEAGRRNVQRELFA